jgi:hypothetical protein
MISLTPLESEVLGEMAWDSYHFGEVLSFVRGADPSQNEPGIYRTVVALLDSLGAPQE